MVLQAAGLAVLASISPTALLVAAVYLGTSRPKVIATYYLAGAVAMSLLMAAVLILVLKYADLSAKHDPRYGFRLGLGLALIAVGALLAWRRRHRGSGQKREGSGWLTKMTADPTPRSAFVVGIIVFAPGATFLAALQVIATAHADFRLTIVAVIVVVVINVMLVWLPVLLYLAAPGATNARLAVLNGWLQRHGATIAITIFILVGLIMCADGISGLV